MVELEEGFDGTIRATVTDPDGAPLPETAVTVRGEEAERSVLTGELGRADIRVLPEGLYAVTVVHENFQPWERTDVLVRDGGTTTLEITLERV